MFHFRAQTGQEVDIILEDTAGRIVGIEVKSSNTVKSDDFTGLRFMADTLEKRFVRGIVLYCGSEYIPFANNLYAMPINALYPTP